MQHLTIIESRAAPSQHPQWHTGETAAQGRREGADNRRESAGGVGGEWNDMGILCHNTKPNAEREGDRNGGGSQSPGYRVIN